MSSQRAHRRTDQGAGCQSDTHCSSNYDGSIIRSENIENELSTACQQGGGNSVCIAYRV